MYACSNHRFESSFAKESSCDRCHLKQVQDLEIKPDIHAGRDGSLQLPTAACGCNFTDICNTDGILYGKPDAFSPPIN